MVTLLVQVLTIPLFLHLASSKVLSTWLILSTIPSYLALADFGLGSVISTAATAFYANGQVGRARAVLSAGWRITGSVISSLILLGIVLSGLIGKSLIGESSSEVRLTISCLALFVAGALYCNYGEARLRVVGSVGTGASLLALGRALDFLGVLTGLLCQPSVVGAAVGQLAGRVLASLVVAAFCRRMASPRLSTCGASSRVNFSDVRKLLRPGLAFLLLPVGSALVTQGVVILVSKQLGAALVVTLAEARVLTNVIRQVNNVLTNGLLPVVTRKAAVGDKTGVSRQLKRVAATSLFFCVLVAVALTGLHAILLDLWLGQEADQPGLGLLLLFVATTAADVPWLTLNVLLVGTNGHSETSFAYASGCALSLVAVYLLTPYCGLAAVPIGLFVIDLVVTPVAYRSYQARLALIGAP